MGFQHIPVGGIDQGVLAALAEEGLRVTHEILVEGIVQAYEEAERHAAPSAAAACLLPRAGDAAGVAGKHGGQEYLQKLKTTHYLYEPQYLAIANFLATDADLANMNDLLSQLLMGHLSESTQLSQNKAIDEDLYRAYVSVSETMMKNENYNEALLMLGNAQTLCNAHPHDDCELYLFHELSKARYGIYDSYLKVAATALKANNSQMSLKYLLLARDFQKNNNNLILSSGAVDRALDELAWHTLQLAGDRQQQQKNQQALDDYLCAQQIYQLRGIEKYDDVIERNIQKLTSQQ